jgi:hypothetical protein
MRPFRCGSGSSILYGLYAARPAAGTAGRLYWATDLGGLFLDTGSAWDSLSIISVDESTGLATYASFEPDGDSFRVVMDGGLSLNMVDATDTATVVGRLAANHTPSTSGGEVLWNGGVTSDTSDTYVVTYSDLNTLVSIDFGTGVAVALPDPSLEGFAAGDRVDFRQAGAGQLTFAGDGDTPPTVNGTPSLTTRAQYSGASAVVVSAGNGTGEWWIVGDLAEGAV